MAYIIQQHYGHVETFRHPPDVDKDLELITPDGWQTLGWLQPKSFFRVYSRRNVDGGKLSIAFLKAKGFTLKQLDGESKDFRVWHLPSGIPLWRGPRVVISCEGWRVYGIDEHLPYTQKGLSVGEDEYLISPSANNP